MAKPATTTRAGPARWELFANDTYVVAAKIYWHTTAFSHYRTCECHWQILIESRAKLGG